MKITELEDEEINDDYKMGELLGEHFTSFLEGLWEEEGMTREPTEQDGDVPEGCRMYTNKAQKLIEAEEKRLHSIGQKYFPGGDTPVESYMYQEY